MLEVTALLGAFVATVAAGIYAMFLLRKIYAAARGKEADRPPF